MHSLAKEGEGEGVSVRGASAVITMKRLPIIGTIAHVLMYAEHRTISATLNNAVAAPLASEASMI